LKDENLPEALVMPSKMLAQMCNSYQLQLGNVLRNTDERVAKITFNVISQTCIQRR